MKRLILLLIVGTCSAAFWFNDNTRDGLSVTWDLNPFSNGFDEMPLTVGNATKQGFVKISDCLENPHFYGNRYMLNGDSAVILIYDKNQYIAGIQAAVPYNESSHYPSTKIQPPIVRDDDYFYITAYFVDPDIICTTGRSESEFEAAPSGTGLFIQNGSSPANIVQIPNQEKDILLNPKWVPGECFYTMGNHYWYDISFKMSCDTIFPVFLLYNAEELTGFGWAFPTNLTSERYEHPSNDSLKMFMTTPPECLANGSTGRISTMHIYLTDQPRKNWC